MTGRHTGFNERAGWAGALDGPCRRRVGNWLTIGVRHGAISADRWRRVHGESLIEVAVTIGALYWQWHAPRWGVILEIGFADEAARDGFRILPAVTAALDAVPDPVNVSWSSQAAVAGRERGGHADPRPAATAGGNEVDEPRDQLLDLVVD